MKSKALHIHSNLYRSFTPGLEAVVACEGVGIGSGRKRKRRARGRRGSVSRILRYSFWWVRFISILVVPTVELVEMACEKLLTRLGRSPLRY